MHAALRKVVLLLTLTATLMLSAGQALAVSVNPQAQFAIPVLVVNTSFLNARSGPGAEFSVVATLVGGTELPVLGIASDRVWYLVATHAGNAWVNVEYTLPRGDFRHVPEIDLQSVIAATVAAQPLTIGFPVTVVQGIDPAAGVEKFRAAINVEAVNLRATPTMEGTVLHILFKNDSVDYAIVGRANDRSGTEWLALDVPGVGVGWVESAKLWVRLSGRYRDVLTVVGEVVGVLERPTGHFLNVPPLVRGDEVFLLDITPDGLLIQVELASGAVGWIPFNSVIGRQNTTTDGLFVPGEVPVDEGSGQGGGGVPQYAPLVAIVNTGNLNIRSGPSAEFTAVATVPGGTQLAVLAVASDDVWYLVSGDFGQGWINKDYVIFRGSFNHLPTIPWDVAVSGAVFAPPLAIAAVPMQLYTAPGIQHAVVGTLLSPNGAPITARTSDSRWVHVQTATGSGWIPAFQIIVRGDLGTVPSV